MLELAVLGLLKERPMHGYDLRKRLREDFGVFSHLSFGSLYPALRRLERSGAVLTAAVPEIRRTETGAAAHVPSTGSLGGERAATIARRATVKAALALGGRGTRARKVYEITEKGEALFDTLLTSPSAGDGDQRGFSLRLAFAQHLTPLARMQLLEQRRQELAELSARAARMLERDDVGLDRYRRSLAEHGKTSLDVEIAWVEELLAREQSSESVGVAKSQARPSRARAIKVRSVLPASAGKAATSHGGER